jgi:hypothetical protein
MRRGLAWLVAVCLMLAGSQVAHVLAYVWVYPQAGVRLRVLLASGHSYMDLMPLVLAVAAAVMLISLLVSGVDAARGRSLRPVPAWAFGVLPLLGFALQEHLERWIATGAFPWHAAGAPTFLPGLLLQLPFGLCAYVVARLLLRTAERLGRALVSRSVSLGRVRSSSVAAAPESAALPRPSLLSCGLAKRGPPVLLGA